MKTIVGNSCFWENGTGYGHHGGWQVKCNLLHFLALQAANHPKGGYDGFRFSGMYNRQHRTGTAASLLTG
jgi:hypothetical protein